MVELNWNKNKSRNWTACLLLSVLLCLHTATVTVSVSVTTSVLPEQCGNPAVKPIQQNPYSRIVGGIAAKPYSWPWQVQILYNNLHHCGATILTNDWIVTAAHCIKGYSQARLLFRAGRYNKFSNAIEPFEQTSTAKRIIYHEHFDPNILDNDIALVQLERAFSWSPQVSPVCLGQLIDSHITPSPGTYVYVTGWGDVFGTSNGDVLKQTIVPIVDWHLCNDAEYHDGWITENMICAGYEGGGTDACQGDSGGPLVKLDAIWNRWHLVGVTSWGDDLCGSPKKPGIYVDISKYIDWIKVKLAQF